MYDSTYDPMDGFRHEWATIGDRHRVRLEGRNTYPDSTMYEIARALSLLMVPLLSREARIVSIFNDDKSGTIGAQIGSTDPADAVRAEDIEEALRDVGDEGWPYVVVNIDIVPRGNESSDHYDHMHHIASSILTGRTPYPIPRRLRENPCAVDLDPPDLDPPF